MGDSVFDSQAEFNSTIRRDTPVILAPAGTPESLKAAAANGATAVYLGVEDFNARMKAGNFTTESLAEWVSYAHLFGVKVYVTLNTLIKEKEFSRACRTAVKVYLSGADGLIVTDIGLARFCAENLSGTELFASTQLSTATANGAKQAVEIGFNGVVAARECRLEDIKAISSVVNTEVFIQGAMCVCVSGQCYMSSMADGNSGNRGRCAQPCRKPYSAFYDGEFVRKGYLLSMKDLCSVETMKELYDAGAGTFKIEGRNRRPEYVAQASKTYRELVDSDFTKDENNLCNLKKTFNRGDYTKGYAWEGNSPSLMSVAVQGHMGVVAGKINGIKPSGGQISVTLDQPFVKGDGFKIFDKKGFEVGNAVALNDSNGEKKGVLFYKGNPSVGDFVSITTDKALEARTVFEPHREIEMSFTAGCGEKAVLTVKSGEKSFTVYSENPLEPSETSPTDEKTVKEQLLRLGDTVFTCGKLSIDTGEAVFIPKSLLNRMRRAAVDGLKEEILKKTSETVSDRRKAAENLVFPEEDINGKKKSDGKTKTKKRILVFSEISQLDDVFDRQTDVLVYKPDDFSLSSKNERIFSELSGVYVDIPNFMRTRDEAAVIELIKTYSVKGVVVNNLGGLKIARELGLHFIAGSGLNIANAKAVEYLKSLGAEDFVFSKELSVNEISDCGVDGFVYAYGALVNMTLTHCPYKTVFRYSDCSECRFREKGGRLVYTDELGNRFTIRRQKIADCYFRVVNPGLLNYGDETHIEGKYLMDLTCGNNWHENYTRGRLFKGVK